MQVDVQNGKTLAEQSYIATILVGQSPAAGRNSRPDETYKVELIYQDDIEHAMRLRDWAAGGSQDPAPATVIPNGLIVASTTGEHVNSNDRDEKYNWYIDPKSFGWTDMTMEISDAYPSMVLGSQWSGGKYFGPWAARGVTELEPYRQVAANPDLAFGGVAPTPQVADLREQAAALARSQEEELAASQDGHRTRFQAQSQQGPAVQL